MKFKKLLTILLLSLSFTLAFTACSKDEGRSSKKAASDEDEDEDEDEEEEASSKKKSKKKKKDKEDSEEDDKKKEETDSEDVIYESDLISYDAEYDEGSYSVQYKLVIHDEESADFYETDYYEDSDYDYSTHMSGEYAFQDDDTVELFVRYQGTIQTLRINLDGEKVTDIEYVYDSGVGELVGNTYNCYDSEIGSCYLEVEEDGSATLGTSDKTYTGYMSKYGEEWNLMVSDPETEESIDWIIYIDGDVFSYETFGEYLYSDYEGEFKAFGQYGDATFKFSGDGKASVDLKIDGKSKHFEGNFYVDTEEERISGAYLKTEDETEVLDLEFDEVDGEMNYHGQYSQMMAAG
ncbi:MAG: hypothetical protein K5888_08690 [Lachnospiraceae bacterium]|nr:hypothetical protein [Lachnospiraceae bacterium]